MINLSFVQKIKSLAIILMMLSLTACELDELVGIQSTDNTSEENMLVRTLTPDPALVIKKVEPTNCIGTANHRAFEVHLIPAAYDFYCPNGETLSYHFILGAGSGASTTMVTSDTQVSNFYLSANTKYMLEVYTVPGNVQISTGYGFMLEDCSNGFTGGSEINQIEFVE